MNDHLQLPLQSSQSHLVCSTLSPGFFFVFPLSHSNVSAEVFLQRNQSGSGHLMNNLNLVYVKSLYVFSLVVLGCYVCVDVF